MYERTIDSRKGRVLAVLAAALLWPLTAAAADQPLRETWYVTTIAGRPVGSIHERLSAGPDGSLVLTTDLHLVLNRMGKKVEMATSATTRESAAGRLARVEAEIKVSDQATGLTAAVGDGAVTLEQRAGGRSFTRSLPFEGELLGPEGVRRLSAARLAAPGDEIHYQTFSPELAAVTRGTRRVLAAETVTSEGQEVPALEVEEALEGSPLVTTYWLDSEGRAIRWRQEGPFGLVEASRSDAATAARAAEGGELPEESYASTLVHTQVRIPRPRELEWLQLELRHRRPGLAWPDLAGPGQTVVESTPERLVLAVERRHPRRGLPFPVAPTPDSRPYLEPNAYIQSDDPALVATARGIVAGESDLFAAGVALERWVAEHMSFDLGVVLAPSVEVFANRRGTCTEYAILLATLARAVGIPARVVLGFVYVDGIFGGHAWTEVLAGDEWIPLDAAVVAAGPADAARFAFQRSSLAGGPAELNFGPAAQLYGQIDARVLAIGFAGEPHRAISADAGLYRVDGDRYTNPGLGLALVKPAGFTFVDLDAVWPDDTVVGLAGPHGAKAELAVKRRYPWEEAAAAMRRRLADAVPEGEAATLEVGGRRGLISEGGGKAALALPVGLEVWLLRVEGEGAGELLRRIAAGLEIS